MISPIAGIIIDSAATITVMTEENLFSFEYFIDFAGDHEPLVDFFEFWKPKNAFFYFSKKYAETEFEFGFMIGFLSSKRISYEKIPEWISGKDPRITSDMDAFDVVHVLKSKLPPDNQSLGPVAAALAALYGWTKLNPTDNWIKRNRPGKPVEGGGWFNPEPNLGGGRRS